MKKYLILLLLLPFVLTGCGNNQIKTVAPYSFIDLGDALEIKGGWNFSDTKYESTVIYCDKKIGVCADYTARLINSHLHIAPMLWKIRSWRDDVIIAESGLPNMYTDHFLYINRKNKRVLIFEKSESENPFDISDLNNLIVTEELQNTFYQRN